VTAGLNQQEVLHFNSRFQVLFYQADEDPALEATVENIVLNEIHIDRYNEQISRLNSNLGRGKREDISTLNALSKLVKDTQATNLSLMNSLSITRAQKQKAKSVVESTPSRFVSAFETMVRNMSADNLKRLNSEMEESARRMQRNLTALKELVPQDVVVEDVPAGDNV
jgi:hypothetical protein